MSSWKPVVAIVAVALATSGCITVVRSSVGTGDVQGDAQSVLFQGDAISDNGRFVAFDSTATNLVPGDTNGVEDVFRRDNLTGVTVRVSVADDGAQAGLRSSGKAISGDGNHVAFQTRAALEPADTNGLDDVYVRTLSTGTTERVSIRPDGTPILTPRIGFSIGDVSFSHDGSTLLIVQGAETSEIFRRDRTTDTTVEDPADPRTALLSSDGRHYVWSRSCALSGPCLGTTNLRTINDDGTLTAESVSAGCGFWAYDLSADGGFVVGQRFEPQPQFQCDGPFGLVRWNRATKAFAPVPVDSYDERFVRISKSGRIVSALGGDGVLRIVDMATGEVQVADTDAFGNPGPGRAGSAVLSGNGKYVAFATLSPLARDDDNHVDDVYTRYAIQPRVTDVSPRTLGAGARHASLRITGAAFLLGATVAAGPGVTVHSVTVDSPTQLTADVSVAADAARGGRGVVVSNTGGFGHADGHCPACLKIA
jgi:hypothetical protein